MCNQQETAALKKASDNRSAPFTRALSHLYTSATFIDELSVDPLETAGSATATLMCLVEDVPKTGDKVRIAMLAVLPSTGEVIYDGRLLLRWRVIVTSSLTRVFESFQSSRTAICDRSWKLACSISVPQSWSSRRT